MHHLGSFQLPALFLWVYVYIVNYCKIPFFTALHKLSFLGFMSKSFILCNYGIKLHLRQRKKTKAAVTVHKGKEQHSVDLSYISQMLQSIMIIIIW